MAGVVACSGVSRTRCPWKVPAGGVGGLCHCATGSRGWWEEEREAKPVAKSRSKPGHPAGLQPQFRTIQKKEVTILSNEECDSFYRNYSHIPSLVWIITSQMICASDPSREQFCYVSVLPFPRGPGTSRKWSGWDTENKD